MRSSSSGYRQSVGRRMPDFVGKNARSRSIVVAQSLLVSIAASTAGEVMSVVDLFNQIA